MKPLLTMRALLIIFGLLFSSFTLFAQDDSLYSFEVEEFTKKTWEWKSELTVAGASKTFNQDSVLSANESAGFEFANPS